MPIPVRPATLLIEKRRQEVQQGLDSQGDVFRVSHYIDFKGSGGTVLDVNFPYWFTDKPAAFHGGELAVSTVLQSGNYPSISVMVIWALTEQAGHQYYTGARLVIVVNGGLVTQRGTAHFHAEGKALVNPIS